MNDPKLAAKRSKAVRNAKEKGVPKDEAFRWVREKYGRFEGHLLEADINRVYDNDRTY